MFNWLQEEYISRVEEEHTESLQKCIYFATRSGCGYSKRVYQQLVDILSVSGRCLLYCKPIKVDIEVHIAKL